MSQTSAVQFAGEARVHVALAVHDVERSKLFYEILLDQPPTKVREGYAKFEVASPSLNLALNETRSATPVSLPSHFGIQVKSTDAVAALTARFREQGLETRTEERVECCYAVQDKVWVQDPDGNRWEVFVVLGDAERYAPAESAAPESCCEPGCCES